MVSLAWLDSVVDVEQELTHQKLYLVDARNFSLVSHLFDESIVLFDGRSGLLVSENCLLEHTLDEI